MTTEDFISELFYRIDETMKDVPKPPLASLWPSEVVTLGVLFALKGVGNRAFSRWGPRDLARLVSGALRAPAPLAPLGAPPAVDGGVPGEPVGLGGWIVTIALLHPLRAGRRAQQIGRKGKSTHRWLVGSKLCLLLNHLGLVVAGGLRGCQGSGHRLPPAD
jgi:hypothetical protein